MKKLITSLLIGLVTLTPGINNNLEINKNITPIKYSSSSGSGINESNVLYDLRIMYGGDNYLNYDWKKLYPNENEDKDLDFKFYCVKPVNDKAYLYLYHKEPHNLDLDKCEFKISTSKEESYSLYSATLINMYGYKGRFMKLVIDELDLTNQYIKIDSVSLKYKNSSRYYNYQINDEISFSNDDNGDFVYEYFKDDYVRIIDGEVAMLLTRVYDNGVNLDAFASYYEDFYYFFKTDRSIDDLLEVQYDYQLVSYTEDHYESGLKTDFMDLDLASPHLGLLSEGDNITNEVVTPFNNNVIKKGTHEETVKRPYFLWWTQDVTYTLSDIQNTKDLSDLEGEDHEYFKTFIEGVQDDTNNKYDWCFRVTSTLREAEAINEFQYWILTNFYKTHTTTTCHEVKQTMITWLKFRDGIQTFELKALDTPRDTSCIVVGVVPYETLLDKIKTIFEDTTNDFENIIKTIVSIVMVSLIIVAITMIVNILKGGIKISRKFNRKRRRKNK